MIFWCLPLPPWLLLAAPGSWLPLGAPSCSKLLLAAPRPPWLLPAAPGCSFQASVAAPSCSKLLAGLRETTMRLVPPRVRRKTKNGAKRTYLDHCTVVEVSRFAPFCVFQN